MARILPATDWILAAMTSIMVAKAGILATMGDFISHSRDSVWHNQNLGKKSSNHMLKIKAP